MTPSCAALCGRHRTSLLSVPCAAAGSHRKRPKPVGHPGFDVPKAMLTPGQKRAEPDRAHPAQAETLPVAVRGKMVGEQGGETPPLPLLQ